MGDNVYIEYWQSILPTIIKQFKAGSQTVQLEVKGLAQYGERQSYYANFRIVNGQLDIPNNAYAQGRDLHQVLVADEYFKDNLTNSTIQITITKNLELKMEILEATAPDFFTEEDFEQLAMFEKERLVENNEDHKITYEFLKSSYNKVEYWAKQVQIKLFKDGVVNIRKRPTNQASRFESYQWAKIYPDKQTADAGILAYTVTIDTDKRFTVKIDTVGLPENDEIRQKYLQVRGDYDNSAIVKILPADQVLDKGWKYLIDLSVNIITSLRPAFDSLLRLLTGLPSKSITPANSNRPDMPLNTILYGPPGTGKTYKLQSLCEKFIIKKATQTREEFLEGLIPDLTWWETIAAALMDIKTASVPDLEKHEFVRIKAKQSTTSNVKQVIWGSLQSRADLACENVKFADRREPYIFWKEANSIWKILEDRVKEECPEIMEFLKKVKEFKPDTGTVQRNYRMVTFHQNFSYEDFIEGIKPVFNVFETDSLQYQVQNGVFYQCCNDAAKLAGYDSINDCLADSKDNRKERFKNAPPYALFIDEINRANVSSVLGELITLIEDDKRLGGENEISNITLPYSKSVFGVPGNLYIIGTMNTADRSVEALDTALRRRFVFEEMEPLPELLNSYTLLQKLWSVHWDISLEADYEKWKQAESDFIHMTGMVKKQKEYSALDEQFDYNELPDFLATDPKVLFNDIVSFSNGVEIDRLLETINNRLSVLLTKDHTIGHAWLINVFSLDALRAVFKNKILPLLQEYFYNDYAKIGLVLGKNFIEEISGQNEFARFDDELASEYTEKRIYVLKNPDKLELKDFISIYR